MPTYYASILRRDTHAPGRFPADEVERAFARRWPAGAVRRAADPGDPWHLTWSVPVGGAVVRGRMFDRHYAMEAVGEAEAALDVVHWYLGVLFAPALFGQPSGATVSEHAGGEVRRVQATHAMTREELGAALAAQPLRPALAPPEVVRCRISEVSTGRGRIGELDPDVFLDALAAQWQDVSGERTRDSYNPVTLRWSAVVGGARLSGTLGRSGIWVTASGPVGACLALACWCRTLVPDSCMLALHAEHLSSSYEVPPGATPALLHDAIDWVLPHLGALPPRPRPPKVPAIPTRDYGRAQRFPDSAGFGWCSIGRTEGGEVWFSDHQALRVLRGGRWRVLRGVPWAPIVGPFARFGGRLWAISDDGLVGYDGVAWHGPLPLPEGRRATSLAADQTHLWALAREGSLWRSQDGAAWEPVPTPEDEGWWQILSDGAGAVWATGRDSLIRRAGDGWEHVPLPGGRWRAADVLHAVLTEPDGTVWAGTRGGLWRFGGDVWERAVVQDPGSRRFLSEPVTGLARDTRGRLWAVGPRRLTALVGGRWQTVRLAVRPASDEGVLPCAELSGAQSAWHEADGWLWVVTMDRSVFAIDTAADLITETDTLTTVYYAPEEVAAEPLDLPFVTPPAPPARMAEEAPPSEPTPPPTPQRRRRTPRQPTVAIPGALVANVSEVARTAAPGELGLDLRWAATGSRGELYVGDTHEWWKVQLPPEVPGVMSAWLFRGQLWALDLSLRLMRLTPTVAQLNPQQGWMGTNEFATMVDRSGRLWLGSAGRVVRSTLDGEAWEELALPWPLFAGPLWSDGAGRLALAELGRRPAGRPIFLHRGGAWQELALPTARSSLVYGVALRGEELWAATSAGLWQHAGGEWRRWRVGAARGGLPGPVLGRLWVDAAERLWAFAEGGPVVYDGQGWRRVAVMTDGGAAWSLADEWLRATWLDERGWLWARRWNGEVGYIDTTAPLEG